MHTLYFCPDSVNTEINLILGEDIIEDDEAKLIIELLHFNLVEAVYVE